METPGTAFEFYCSAAMSIMALAPNLEICSQAWLDWCPWPEAQGIKLSAPRVRMAKRHYLWLHFGVDELHPFATYFDVHQGSPTGPDDSDDPSGFTRREPPRRKADLLGRVSVSAKELLEGFEEELVLLESTKDTSPTAGGRGGSPRDRVLPFA